MKIHKTRVFDETIKAIREGATTIVHQGGSRSSKSWSIIQTLMELPKLVEYGYAPDHVRHVMAARKKLSWLKGSLFNTLDNAVSTYKIPVEPDLLKTRGTQEYTINGFHWNLQGIDDPQRAAGEEQDIAWLNEANDFTKDDYDQVAMRTSWLKILDYNPNMPASHWIEDLKLDPEVVVIKSTVLDNPHAAPESRKVIMGYEPTPENIERGTADDFKWKVYGLGERAMPEGLVYPHYTITSSWPDSPKYHAFGIDFGWNNPATIVEIAIAGPAVYIRQHLYGSGIPTEEIGNTLKEVVPDGVVVVADSASPEAISKLNQRGVFVVGAKKGADSVRTGIDTVKENAIRIHEDSVDVRKEIQNYTWAKDKSGEPTDKPVDAFNHALDAARYAVSWVLAPQIDYTVF